MNYNKEYEKFENIIYQGVTNSLKNPVQNKIARVKEAVEFMNGQFFNVLAKNIIGKTSPPNLGLYSENWEGLSDTYAKHRLKKYNIAKNKFFIYSGKLGNTQLQTASANNSFGKPQVIALQVGRYGRQEAYVYGKTAYNPNTGRHIPFEKLKDLQWNIGVRLYPKIAGDISRISAAQLGQYLPYGKTESSSNLALKINREDLGRPVLRSYMKWWLYVVALETMRKAIK